MAFLSTSSRFGPDVRRHEKVFPTPTTYEPAHVTVAAGSRFHTANQYGTIGPHHDAPLERKVAASAAAEVLAAVETSPSSPNSVRRKAPTPWHYTPTVQGQFERVFTVSDMEAQRRRRLQEAKRTAASRADDPAAKQKPVEVQRLALGPGTYEVDKDWNLETIAVPFSFGKEPRRGILECKLGEKDLRADHGRQDKYSGKLSSDQRRLSETALLPLRRVAASSGVEPSDVAAISKELAESYAVLHRSAARLERKLATPAVRLARFQRFDSGRREIESCRRGPGSYFDTSGSSSPPTRTGDGAMPDKTSVVSSSLPLDDEQRQELKALLAKALTGRTAHDATTRRTTTFGLVKHRDMLTSMTKAGHLSAVAVDDAVGPGVYETATSTLEEPTHNLRYKKDAVQKRKQLRTQTVKMEKKNEEQEEETALDAASEMRAQWIALRRGPQWTLSSKSR